MAIDPISEMMRRELTAVRYTLLELQEAVAIKEQAGVPVLDVTYTSIETLQKQVKQLEIAIQERKTSQTGGILNRLSETELRTGDTIFGRLLILWGVICAAGVSIDTAGWDDPVFTVVHKVPFTPYSWAGLLFAFTVVYAVGELLNPACRHRGRVVIIGASLCMIWHLTLALAMARMVYIMPMRITDLWPLVVLLVAALYASRIVVYANAFSGHRWATNPYQLWSTLLLMVVSLSQAIVQVAPTNVLSQIEHPVALQVIVANFLGAAVVMFGLHMRDKEYGINLELAGAISLLTTMVTYLILVISKQNISSLTFNFGLTLAFVLGTLHRCSQIMVLKWARWQGKQHLERRMAEALTPVSGPAIPPAKSPVEN